MSDEEPRDFDDIVFHNMVAWRKCANWMKIERDALRAENARLREALEEINKRDSYPPDGYGVWAEIARKALEVKP